MGGTRASTPPAAGSILGRPAASATRLTTAIHPSGRAYDGLADFFARVPWSSGSRYVEAACNDSDTIPGRR